MPTTASAPTRTKSARAARRGTRARKKNSPLAPAPVKSGLKSRSRRPEPAKPASAASRNLQFLREFIKSPGSVCAVAPSSRFLAREMVRGLDLGAARVIVEYGPGSGVFTEAVERNLPKSWRSEQRPGGPGKLIAIELNPSIAALFRRRHPRAILHRNSAERVIDICRAEGVEPGSVDLVISGLGWPSFPPELRTRILENTAAALRPGGEFRTFGYHCGLLMPGAWHFRREVKRLFSKVTLSEIVWRNAPPAFVYRCVK